MLATVAVNVALVNPAPTLTLAGTVILALLLDSVTVDPPAGATPVNVTVQLEVPGAFTVAGEQLKLLGWAGDTKLSVTVFVTPPVLAVTTAV
jgi:hypothetical protein